jgi:hypothetical protein
LAQISGGGLRVGVWFKVEDYQVEEEFKKSQLR